MLKIPRELLESLAPEHPINQDEMGGCVFCAGTPPGHEYGYSGRFHTDHRPECPWVEARHLLGDKLPESRAAQEGKR